MNGAGTFGRLLNLGGELIAEGPCWLNETSGEATMEPERTPGMIQSQRGRLQLELENGRLFPVSDKPMILRLRSWNGSAAKEMGRKLYRLRLLDWGDGAPHNDAQEAAAAGAAEEGSPAPRQVGGPRFEETPAARFQ